MACVVGRKTPAAFWGVEMSDIVTQIARDHKTTSFNDYRSMIAWSCSCGETGTGNGGLDNASGHIASVTEVAVLAQFEGSKDES